MISPSEIRSQAFKWWKQFLQAYLRGESFFPKTIDRIGKIKSSEIREDINALQSKLEALYQESKERISYGYTVNKAEANFRKTGRHVLPQSITIDTIHDYICLLGKQKEWKKFLENVQLIRNALPALEQWIVEHPLDVIDNEGDWANILLVCRFFIDNPRPVLYLRQLPIPISTKFIETHQAVIVSLLDFLIPDHRRNEIEKEITLRFHLKYDEPTIRVRILDRNISVQGLSDMRIPLSNFSTFDFKCNNVIITENKMNFLALPELTDTIAIWSGGGFNINVLKEIPWLNSVKIFYWGDLDIQGFQILHQMRTYYSHTRSVMMDTSTFNKFKKEGLLKGKPGTMKNLNCLNAEELQMFAFLKQHNCRLEQEKIWQVYSDNVLHAIIN